MSAYRSLFALLSSYGILLIANGLFSTIVSIRSKTEAFPDSIIGVVLSGYFAGLLLSSFYAARMVAAIGHIRAFALFASLASTVALGHSLWVNPTLWGIFRLISGFCMGGMIVVTEGWLNERADNNNRGQIMSAYMITTYACAGSAQLIMMWNSPDGFHLFVFVSILYSLSLIPILVTRSQTPSLPKPNRPNIWQLYKVSPVGMIGSFIVGYVNGIFYSLAPVFAYNLGLDPQQTAIFIAIAIMSGMLLQLPLGKLSDHIDRRWVIIFSSLMTTLACYLLFINDGSNPTSLYLYGLFYGSVAFSINPICIAHVNDLTSNDERTQTSGGLLMTYGIGAVIGPILAGFVMQNSSQHIFMMSGIMTLVLAFYTLLRLWKKPRHQQKKRHFKAFVMHSPAGKFVFSRRKQSSAK